MPEIREISERNLQENRSTSDRNPEVPKGSSPLIETQWSKNEGTHSPDASAGGIPVSAHHLHSRAEKSLCEPGVNLAPFNTSYQPSFCTYFTLRELSLFCQGGMWVRITEPQNILSWKGSRRVTEPSSWPYTRQPTPRTTPGT